MPIEGKDANVLRSVGQRIPVPHLPGGRRTATLTPPAADETVIGPPVDEAGIIAKPRRLPQKSNLAERLILTGLMTAGTGFVGYQAWENPPTPGIADFKQTVIDRYEQFLKSLGLELYQVPPSFSNKGNKGIIGFNNVRGADLEDINKASQASETALLIPIKGLASSVTPTVYTKDLLGKNPANPIFPEDIRQKAIEEGVRNIVVFENVAEGIELVAPHDGELLFFMRERLVPLAPEGSVERARVFFEDSSGIAYDISIGGKPGDYFIPLISAKPYNGDRDVDRKTLKVSVKRGQPILKTLKKGDIEMSSMARPNKIASTSTYYPVDIKLLTLTDPTGEEKLVVAR